MSIYGIGNIHGGTHVGSCSNSAPQDCVLAFRQVQSTGLS